MSRLTILTPTYNRGNEIIRLYESLCRQTNMDFDWLVVDDGSTDKTGMLISNWKKDNMISIEYIKKENGGKHTALNLGISRIKTEWIFIVDSDDYLIDDAISIFYKKVEGIKELDHICGMAFLRQSYNGSYLTNKLVPQDGLVENFCECRYGRSIKGDMAEIWRTRCLKEFPFPVFEGERFLSEDIVWIMMAQKYKMIFYNTVLYMSDYLEGGLTNNRRKNNLQSPKGCMYRGELQLAISLPIKYKIRAMLYYSVYGRIAGYTFMKLLKKSKWKGLYMLCLPFSIFLFLKWRI